MKTPSPIPTKIPSTIKVTRKIADFETSVGNTTGGVLPPPPVEPEVGVVPLSLVPTDYPTSEFSTELSAGIPSPCKKYCDPAYHIPPIPKKIRARSRLASYTGLTFYFTQYSVVTLLSKSKK